jgi:hypothetical protein
VAVVAARNVRIGCAFARAVDGGHTVTRFFVSLFETYMASSALGVETEAEKSLLFFSVIFFTVIFSFYCFHLDNGRGTAENLGQFVA